MKFKYLEWILILSLAFVANMMSSCSKDSDDGLDSTDQPGNSGNTGGGGSNSGETIRTKGYYEYQVSENVLHDNVYYNEYHSTQIQFTSSTICRVRNSGVTY